MNQAKKKTGTKPKNSERKRPIQSQLGAFSGQPMSAFTQSKAALP
jgi:hypothetical protein